MGRATSIRRRPGHPPATIAAVLLVAACGAGVEDQSDVPLPGQPVEVFRIGRDQGESWETLSQVRDVTFDDGDNIYIADGGSSSVLVYDSHGRFVRRIGRRGGGPGELRAASSIQVTASRRVVISDRGQAALVVYDSAGNHLRNIGVQHVAGGVRGLYELGADRLLLFGVSPPGESRKGSALIVDPDSEVTRPVLDFPIPPMLTFRVGTGESTLLVSRTPEYGPDPFVRATRDGTIYAQYETEYRIRIFDTAGAQQRVIERPVLPRPVGDAEKQAWERRRQDLYVVATGRPGPAPPMSYDVPFAAQMSIVTGLIVDPVGRLWVQRRLPDGAPEGPIDLLTTGGEYIGTLQPQPMPAAVSKTGLAAWLIRDELGVERISIRRLPDHWR
jgi:hypothetical protein